MRAFWKRRPAVAADHMTQAELAQWDNLRAAQMVREANLWTGRAYPPVRVTS